MNIALPLASGAAAIILLSAAVEMPDGNSVLHRAGESGTAFSDTVALNPMDILDDPYRAGLPYEGSPPSSVCAVHFTDSSQRHYLLKTFDTAREAVAAGYRVTHHGACGACSPLRDLDVYLRNPDLTRAARKCAFRMSRRGITRCLEGLGMSSPCARIWYYNIRNTARHCLGTCLRSWMRREPYNGADGSLNRCLRCDEEKSGPLFKRYAGRTRRNSGIESEIVRGADEVLPVGHGYR
ncbi:MAG: hypothetical protein JW838_03435 [Spirochaetes bacterium]|nr:hypothetical protein [Spirochaetota bacterium]